MLFNTTISFFSAQVYQEKRQKGVLFDTNLSLPGAGRGYRAGLLTARVAITLLFVGMRFGLLYLAAICEYTDENSITVE
jgi:hypothetical protein